MQLSYNAEFLAHAECVSRGNYRGAAAHLENILRAVRTRGSNEEAAYILQRIGQMHWEDGNEAKAVRYFDEAIAASPMPLISLMIARFVGIQCGRMDLAAKYAAIVLTAGGNVSPSELAQARGFIGPLH